MPVPGQLPHVAADLRITGWVVHSGGQLTQVFPEYSVQKPCQSFCRPVRLEERHFQIRSKPERGYNSGIQIQSYVGGKWSVLLLSTRKYLFHLRRPCRWWDGLIHRAYAEVSISRSRKCQRLRQIRFFQQIDQCHPVREPHLGLFHILFSNSGIVVLPLINTSIKNLYVNREKLFLFTYRLSHTILTTFFLEKSKF